MSGEPEDPVSPLLDAAISTHELFLAYQSAGFTEKQAMELVKAFVMTATSRGEA